MPLGMKVCFNTGVESEIAIKANGGFTIRGPSPASLAPYVDFALSLKNVSEVLCTKSYAECVDRLLKNEYDFALHTQSIHDTSGNFVVPVPAFATSVNILSGYNIHKYQQQNYGTMQSVLANLTSYSESVYLLMVIFMLSLLLIILANVLLVQRRRCVSRAIRKSVKYFGLFMRAGCHRRFLPSLILNLGLFLIITPFFLLFKTNQVVVDEPPMIKSYRQIIDQRIGIMFTAFDSDVSDFLKLQANLRGGNLEKEIFEYFRLNARRVKLEQSPRTFELLANLSKEIIQREQVFIGFDKSVETMRQLLCSWTTGDDLYQIVPFRDPHQEEIILGYIFRKGLEGSQDMIKRLRRVFEGHITSKIPLLVDSYLNNFKLVRNKMEIVSLIY